MAKRFKLRFSRMIPSFQFCRSKHPNTFPVSPAPSICKLSPINTKAIDISYPNFPNPPPSTPQEPTPVHPSIKCHVSSRLVSVGCGCRSKSCTQYLSSEYSTESPDYTWTKDGKWHVVGKPKDEKPRRKIYSASDSGDTDDDIVSSATPLLKTKKQMKKQKSKTKLNVKASTVRKSTSSTTGDSGWFTSEENEETSISFSNDSSFDFDNQFQNRSEKLSNNRKKKTNVKKVRKLKRYVSTNWSRSGTTVVPAKTKTTTTASPAAETETPLRMSVFRRMMPCTVEGKVTESFAVEKKSEDPYEDFKKSMLEMILEKQMFDTKDLEELLHCFLSLNSKHHHGVIVEAFTEIWEVLFGKSPVNQRVPIHR